MSGLPVVMASFVLVIVVYDDPSSLVGQVFKAVKETLNLILKLLDEVYELSKQG